jgi:tetratricopeptide (TPR) repeat protein
MGATTLQRWSRLLLAAAVICALDAATPASSKERLRRLARLPILSVRFTAALDPMRGFDLTWPRVEAAKQLAEVNQSLRGDASDAARYGRLAALYSELGEAPRSQAALKRALELYRQQGAGESDNGELMAGYGETLRLLGQYDEAQRVLRRAVKAAPKEWKCHAALGRCQASQGLAAVFAEASPPAVSVLPLPLASLKPSSGQLEKAQKLIAEALEAHDRAVILAPDQPEVYVGRASAQGCRGWLQAVARLAGGEELDLPRQLAAVFCPAALSDLEQAARRKPKDARAWGTLAFFEVFAASAAQGRASIEQVFGQQGWSGLPDQARAAVRQAVSRLEELSQSGEAPAAAAALELLGIIQQLFVADKPAAEASLRRAVELDPSRQQAWESLTALLVDSDRAQELLSLCETRLKHQDTARNRLLLAKALERLKQPERLLAQTQAALDRYPEDLNLTLARAAALMQTGDDDDLPPASQLLAKAQRLAQKAPGRDELENLLFLQGLLWGMTGRKDEARAVFNKLLELDKDNTEAQEALQALE